MDAQGLYKIIFQQFKDLLYPQEWIDLDLSFSKTEIITLLLLEQEGEMIMSKLAEELGVPLSTATGVVERVVKKGYLLRERSEKDRRIVVIRLTQEGKELVNSIKEKVFYWIDSIQSSLTQEELILLEKVISKVMKTLKSPPGEASSREESRGIKRIDIE